MVTNILNFYYFLNFLLFAVIDNKKEKVNKIRIICYFATFCYPAHRKENKNDR